MKAVVTGMIGTFPVGGVAWDYGQYALGLERLGFEVYYLEDTGWHAYDPRSRRYGDDCEYGVEFLARALAGLSPSLAARWHFRAADGRTFGLDAAAVAEAIADAALLLNVSGGCMLRDEYMSCPRKVLIDTDPGWNHFVKYPAWDAHPGEDGSNGYRAHDHFFTYAQRIGKPDCSLPTLGLDWHPTRPPVLLDCWSPEPPGERWTTVFTWDNYRRPLVHEGVSYGSKEPEFKRVEGLPARSDAAFELAAGGVDPPRERWRAKGWSVIDSHSVSELPDDYRRYVQRSRGELSVAKNVYVATLSGWFSCRSVCYLAAGRPAVLQDTGFSESIPTGEGLLGFTNLDGAAEAVAAVEADYDRHSWAARAIAQSHFDSDLVLGEILERVGLAEGSPA
jgi:hypothetical protein